MGVLGLSWLFHQEPHLGLSFSTIRNGVTITLSHLLGGREGGGSAQWREEPVMCPVPAQWTL